MFCPNGMRDPTCYYLLALSGELGADYKAPKFIRGWLLLQQIKKVH